MAKSYKINEFKKSKKYLLCINSGGTVIDAMNVKHNLCYGPSFIEVWNLKPYEKTIQKIWNDINLFEKSRGLNRFLALVIMLERINGFYIHEENIKVLKEWTKAETKLSNEKLYLYTQDKSDPILTKALQWSKLIDEKSAQLDSSLKPPFENSCESLKLAYETCDIAIISGSTIDSVLDEWKDFDMLKYVDVIASQEDGTKSEAISELIHKGYDQDSVLMIGDALSDFEAAHNTGIFYYPILVHDEVASWGMFKDFYLEKFITEAYPQFQDALIKMFDYNLANKLATTAVLI